MTVDWNGRTGLVTGGASFIGSHLVDALVARGARVRVVDDLSGGRVESIGPRLDARRIEFIDANLSAPGMAEKAVDRMNVVFPRAADHSGAGAVGLLQYLY